VLLNEPPPVADHVTPAAPTSLVTVAAKFSPCPCVNPPRLGVSATEIFPANAATVIVAAPDFVPSVTEVAVKVTVVGDGTAAGAEYVIPTPDALAPLESVPQVAPLQPTPDSAQVTPWFCVSFVTVAVKTCVPPEACTVALGGATLTAIAGGAVTVIVAAPDFVPSATEVAVKVTVAGEGTAAGAV